jgi:hypothetical protein
VNGFVRVRLCACRQRTTETNRIHLVLVSMQNRTLGPYLAAENRTFISVTTFDGADAVLAAWSAVDDPS